MRAAEIDSIEKWDLEDEVFELVGYRLAIGYTASTGRDRTFFSYLLDGCMVLSYCMAFIIGIYECRRPAEAPSFLSLSLLVCWTFPLLQVRKLRLFCFLLSKERLEIQRSLL